MSTKADILIKIRSKGYWIINIHPNMYVENRIDKRSLKGIMQKATVNLSGWSYPYSPDHVDEPHPISNGIETSVDSDFRLEFWRLTQSANFLQLLTVYEDWRDYSDYKNIWSRGDELKGKKLLGVFNALYTLTNTFEFARRLGTQDIFDEDVLVNITLNNLNDRILFVDSREKVPFSWNHISHESSWKWKRSYAVVELLNSSSACAFDAFQDLAYLFNWDPLPVDSLKNDQEKFLQGTI